MVSTQNFKHIKTTHKQSLIRKVIQEVLDYRISQPIHSFIKDMEKYTKIQLIYTSYNSAFRDIKRFAIFVEADMLKNFSGKFANHDLEYKFTFLIDDEWR